MFFISLLVPLYARYSFVSKKKSCALIILSNEYLYLYENLYYDHYFKVVFFFEEAGADFFKDLWILSLCCLLNILIIMVSITILSNKCPI